MDTEFASKVFLPVLGFAVAIGLAVWKYVYEVGQKRRENQLQRINAQLKNLYGPLYTLLEARAHSWRLFTARYDLSDWKRKGQSMPAEHQAGWEAWVQHQAETTNQKIYQLITENADLYLDQRMPTAFQSFIAHYMEYQDILARWAQGDKSVLFSKMPYPDDEIAAHVKETFEMLKLQQSKLLGTPDRRLPPQALQGEKTHRHSGYDAESPP
jgi:hypothetical protein